jgi:hypothetical protein
MLKQIVHRVFRRHHFWREVGFSELSELYVSSMLRTLSTSLLMVFVPFFMYQQGYGLTAIFVTFGTFFLTRTITDPAAGHIVGRFGPKHTMIVSCILQIGSAILFLLIPRYHLPSWLLGIPWGAATSCYFIAFHVEFSKIKHTAHSGKEIGYMNIMEKIGAILGPIFGGLVGTVFGSQYIFLMAILILVASLWPLFLSAEPTQVHQKLAFRDLPLKKVLPDIRAFCAMGLENTICINLWPFYVALFALNGRQVYAQLGALSSAAVLGSLLSAYAIGKYIDARSGRRLLRLSTVFNSLLYVFRPFVTSLAPALAVNVANEAVTAGYRMPFIKGMYAAADELPGHRIVYVVSMEMMASIVKSTVWFMLAILASGLSTYSVMVVGFVIAGSASLLIMTEQFKALKPRTIMRGHHA